MTRASGIRRCSWAGVLVVVTLLVASCGATGTPMAAPTTVSSTTVPLPMVTSTMAPSTVGTAAAPSPLPTAPSPTGPIGPTAIAPLGLPGVNDPDCTSRYRPVVLLHGTFSTTASTFSALSSALQAAGRCLYGIDYGRGGVQPVRSSAQAVADFIDLVLTATGAEQVDVVAYSQGGLVLRTALRLDGVASEVATAVMIAPTFHGSTSPLLDSVPAGVCAACADQAAGSPLLAELDAGNSPGAGDLDGDVRYAVVSSRDDTIVTPIASQVPLGSADRIHSLIVQDQCPGEFVDHVALPADPGVVSWIADALDTDGSPNPAALTCR